MPLRFCRRTRVKRAVFFGLDYTLHLSTGRKAKLFEGSPQPDRPLIFHGPPPTPLFPTSNPFTAFTSLDLIPPSSAYVFFLKFPPPPASTSPSPSAFRYFWNSSQDPLFPPPPGKWHRITYYAVKANLFIITIPPYLHGMEKEPLSATEQELPWCT